MTLAVYSATRQLGSISLAGGTLTGSNPGLQDVADVAVRRAGGNPAQAYAALDGWTNGYLTIITDPAEQDAQVAAGPAVTRFDPDFSTCFAEMRNAQVAAAFDPGQARDSRGRWAKSERAATAAKDLTQPQALAAAREVAANVARAFGAAPPRLEVWEDTDLEPDAQYKNGAIRVRKSLLGRIRSRDYGAHDLRVISHETVHHAVSGKTEVYGEFSKRLEEGGTELLSIAHWQRHGPAYNKRDAVRRAGRFTAPGDESLAATAAYKDDIPEIMRRAASVAGWDRAGILRVVEQALRADHNGRLDFRNTSDPGFPLPAGVKADAEPMLAWLLERPAAMQPAAAFRKDEHPRDQAGRFTRVGGGAGPLPAGPLVVRATGQLNEGERMCRDGYMSRDGNEIYQHWLRDGTTRPYEFEPGGSIWDLDHAIAKYTLRDRAVAYRGIADNGLGLKPGATIHDDGYTSVSEDRAVAEWFARMRAGGEHYSGVQWGTPVGGIPVVVAMVLPAGTHAMPGDDSVKEFVLPRGGTYEITGSLPDGTLVADWKTPAARVPAPAVAAAKTEGPVDLAALPPSRGMAERMAGAPGEVTVSPPARTASPSAAFAEDLHPRDKAGKFTSRGGGGQTPSRFTHPATGHQMGKTEIGDTFEALFAGHGAHLLTGRYGGPYQPVTPRTAPLDFTLDRTHGGELKTLNLHAASRKAAMKAAEVARKEAAASDAGLAPLLVVQVIDTGTSRAEVFAHPAFASKTTTKMEHLGGYWYKPEDFQAAQEQTGHWAQRDARAQAQGVRAAAPEDDPPPEDPEPEPGDTVIELRDGVPWIGTQPGPDGDVEAAWREALHLRKHRGEPGGGEFTKGDGGAAKLPEPPAAPEPPRGPGRITVLNDGTTTDPATGQPRAYLADPAVRAAAIAEVQHGLTAQHQYIPHVTERLAVRLGDPLGQSGTKTLGVTIVEQKGRPPAPRTLEEILEQAETEHAGGEGEYAEGIRLAPWITRAAMGGKPDRSLAKAQERGWWVPSDPEWNLTDTTVAHETGHVAAAQVPAPVMSSMAVWGPVAAAAGLPPPQVFSGFGKPPDQQVVSPGKWLSENRAAVAAAVSEYGAKSVGELEAELWSEYTTNRTPRPPAKAYGDFLRGYLGGPPVMTRTLPPGDPLGPEGTVMSHGPDAPPLDEVAAAGFAEDEHPRKPRGVPGGGEFTDAPGPGPGRYQGMTDRQLTRLLRGGDPDAQAEFQRRRAAPTAQPPSVPARQPAPPKAPPGRRLSTEQVIQAGIGKVPARLRNPDLKVRVVPGTDRFHPDRIAVATGSSFTVYKGMLDKVAAGRVKVHGPPGLTGQDLAVAVIVHEYGHHVMAGVWNSSKYLGRRGVDTSRFGPKAMRDAWNETRTATPDSHLNADEGWANAFMIRIYDPGKSFGPKTDAIFKALGI